MEEKEERIQHLEEVNRTLKQTNDDLQEELRELRAKLDIVTAEVCMCMYVHVHVRVYSIVLSHWVIWLFSWNKPSPPVRHLWMNPRS